MEDGKQAPDAERTAARKQQAESGRKNIVAFNQSRGGRPALKHGICSLTDNGEVPQQIEGAQEITERVDGIIAEFISDLGGESAITAGRRSILASLRLSLLVLELSARFIAANGLLDARGKPHALLTIANSFGNSARLHAAALGLERVSKNVTPTLDAALEQLAAKENHANH
jgi:hypothetical protein